VGKTAENHFLTLLSYPLFYKYCFQYLRLALKCLIYRVGVKLKSSGSPEGC
jgi:hypothetical protein